MAADSWLSAATLSRSWASCWRTSATRWAICSVSAVRWAICAVNGFKLLARGALLLAGFGKLGGYTFKLLSLLADLLGKLVRLLLRFGALLLDRLGLRLGRLALGGQFLQLLLAGLDFLAQPVDLAGQPLFVLHGGAQPVQVALNGLALIPRGVALAGKGCDSLLIFPLTLGELLFQVAALDPERDCRYHRDDRHHGQSQQVVSQVSPASAGFVRAGHGYPLCSRAWLEERGSGPTCCRDSDAAYGARQKVEPQLAGAPR